jgi:imidazolonepropionase-like amidohydrolase
MLRSDRARLCARTALAFLMLSIGVCALGQIDTEPVEGLHENSPRVHALTNARVHIRPGVELDSATIVLRDGLVEAVGENVAAPADARIWDLEGRTVYPGFIDPMSEIGLPAALRRPRPRNPDDEGPPPETPEQSADGFWNPAIRPETDAATLLDLDEDEIEAMRNVGFTTVLTVPRRGILRGQSALLSTSDPLNARRSLLKARVAAHAGAELSDDDYPTSLMGAIALMRQAFYDAQWYESMNEYYAANPDVERAAVNSALAALEPVVDGDEYVVYAADDELDYERALKIGREFGLDIALYGNGHEYRKLDLLSSLTRPIIVPINFPEPPDIDTPDGALDVSLETLQHWELAPSNPAFLANAGIAFALTADGIDDVGEDLWANIRLAVERGLPADTALAALTTVPAGLVGMPDSLGTLEPGKIADLVVADSDLFSDEDAEIELVFVDGDPYELDGYNAAQPEGRWSVTWPTGSGEWTIAERGPRLALSIGDAEFRGRMDGDQIVLFPAASVLGDGEGLARLSGFVADGAIEGLAELPDGRSFTWRAAYLGEVEEEADGGEASADAPGQGGADSAEAGAAADANTNVADDIPPLVFPAYPAGAYGLASQPAQPDALLIRGATIWTSGPEGRLENADLLIRSGRFAAVGQNLDAPRGAMIIDAAGKHVTAGIIDAHSHTAISRGINETGSAITMEVRIADVLNPTDINIYRQLAGGLTVANVMHGSANPIGGQIQTIKLRWGGDADGLVFEGAPAGVKFALGENVKQSNWGDEYTTRYPQSRMGVDEIIRDAFDAARAYREARESAGRNDPPVRRNLRLDAALEILDRDRRIQIHSYRQDEILAFIRLAQDYGLYVGAFQHVLEGYKVAPEIAALGAGGSTFSDWWGYKYEVIDAIPYNGALMRQAGVVVSFNSDDDELATRLNTEAAKAVKYGGVPETEALKFVTINSAIQLGIDDRVGSIEPGKDADFVIWSGDPLSTFTRAEQTWIDGRKYFDIDTDAAMRAADEAERSRLIQKVLSERLEEEGPPDGSDDDGGGGEQGAEPELRSNTPAASSGRAARVTDVYSSAARRSGEEGEGHE